MIRFILALLTIFLLTTAVAVRASETVSPIDTSEIKRNSRNRTEVPRHDFSSSARDEAAIDDSRRLHDEIMQYTIASLQRVRGESRSCSDCYAGGSGSTETLSRARATAKHVCEERWADYYNTPPMDPRNPGGEKKPLDLRVSLGYMDTDANSVVHDILMRQAFVKSVTAKCPTNLLRACGFKENERDGDLFEKEVMGPTGEMQKVHLRITASSYSLLNQKNRDNQFEQFIKSQQAEDSYYGAIKDKADLSIYVGHARDSGGPDFSPADRKKSDGTIDYTRYRRDKPGIAKLRKAFKEAQGATPRMMAFLACDSTRWENEIQKLAPNSGIILSKTDKIALEIEMAFAYTLIDSVLWQRCKTEFNRAMNTVVDARPEEKIVPLSVDQFFER